MESDQQFVKTQVKMILCNLQFYSHFCWAKSCVNYILINAIKGCFVGTESVVCFVGCFVDKKIEN